MNGEYTGVDTREDLLSLRVLFFERKLLSLAKVAFYMCSRLVAVACVLHPHSWFMPMVVWHWN